MMTPTNDTPRIAECGTNVNGMGYTLTSAQKERKKQGKTIYQRDRKVDEYWFSKGSFV